jgi:hypothetical protein
MSTVQPYDEPLTSITTLGSGGRLARQTGRDLAHISARSTVCVARIEAAAELQAMKASAVSYVGRRAMQEIAVVSQIETQLATAVPHASGRVAAVADLTAIAMSGVVVDSARRIGRCG